MSEPLPNEHISEGEPQPHGLSAPSHSASVEAVAFSEADWDAFRNEDFAAGKAVVVLMLGIFLMGVLLYSVVAYFVAQ